MNVHTAAVPQYRLNPELGRLREENERLQGLLKRHFSQTLEVPGEWKLSKNESRLFLALLDGRPLTAERAWTALYWDRPHRDDDFAKHGDYTVIRVVMYDLKRKLHKALGEDAPVITNAFGGGYVLKDAAAWKKILTVFN